MKKYFLQITFFILAFLSIQPAFSQEREIKAADDYFGDLQYQLAIEKYTKAWDKLKKQTYEKQRVEHKLAECYRLTNKPNDAVVWYGKIADTKLAEKKPEIWLHYADALRSTGNCEKATIYYRKFIDKAPDNPLGKTGLESCEVLAASAVQSPYEVSNQKTINSADDDYSPSFSSKNSDQLFFASTRKGSAGKDHENWTGAFFSDIYQSVYKNTSWENPSNVDGSGFLNSEANEGTPFFNSKFSTVYFTRCEKSPENKVYCQIMESDRQGKRWTKPVTVLKDGSSNTGHPCLSKDELVIYFVSDRKGGYGGKDIWMALRTGRNKPFGPAVNLGKVINTAGDEMFPDLIHDSLLYFSSNGHPGFGGLDLFKAIKQDSTWSKPTNLLPPLNSVGDDFSIIFKNDNEGYFSSNRTGGKGGDDIYHFVKKSLQFTLSGTVKDQRTLFTLPGATALLISSSGDSISEHSNEQGFYTFGNAYISENQSYQLVLSNENYFSVKNEINTNSFSDNHDFVINALLQPIPEESVLLPDILFDLAKWDLKPQYQDSLLVLVKVLNDNPNLVIEIRSHTDSRASIEFNDELSQKRAQSVVDFLISKGTDPGRLVAKGFGEREPRKLDKDIISGGYSLKKGSVLSESFIESLASNELKETVHKLNRRIELKVIAKNYKPLAKTTSEIPQISLINDSVGMVVPFTLTDKNLRMINCFVNSYETQAIVISENGSSYIGEQKLIGLMRIGAISKSNFEGNAEEILQNNQVQDGAVINIGNLRIGDISHENFRVLVRKDIDLPLTLGSDIIEIFGTCKIDDLQKQLIFK
jgi:peptidoglycan-associated lipoprotein